FARGATADGFLLALAHRVSIRAPRSHAGRPRSRGEARGDVVVSIRAPRSHAGRPATLTRVEYMIDVSIRAPRSHAGRPWHELDMLGDVKFQSAPRVRTRGDLSGDYLAAAPTMFQSAPRVRTRGDRIGENRVGQI